MISAIAGVVGHVVPDAMMHYDVRPFAPFSDANPFYEFVSLGALHLGLVVAGFLGALVVAFSRFKVDAG